MVNGRRSKGKATVNPLMRSRQRPGRPKVAFDGQILQSNKFFTATTTSTGQGKDYNHISGNQVYGVLSSALGICQFYNNYKFRWVKFEWIPTVSPASVDAGSRIHICYVDNPEKIVAFDGATAAAAVVNVKGTKNCKTFNAWERTTFNVPLTYRRKLFDIDVTDPTVSVDDADRTTQGQVQIAYESVSAAVVLGVWKVTYAVELHGLTLTEFT